MPLNVVTWSNTAITAVVPTGLRTGQLSIDAGQSTCTVDTTPLSTLAGGITAAAGSLSVANGDGKKFALGTLIQVDSEAMGVTGGNRSTLAATLGTTASTLARDTLRVPHTLGAATGDGQIFTPAGYVSGSFASPIYVSVDSEVITLIGKSTTSLTSALGGGGFNLTLNVTAGTGSGRFAIGDYIKVDNETMLVVLPLANSITVARGQLGTSRVAHASGAAVVAHRPIRRQPRRPRYRGGVARLRGGGGRRRPHRHPRPGRHDRGRPLGGCDGRLLPQDLRHDRLAQVDSRRHAERGDGGHAHGPAAQDRRPRPEHPGSDRHGDRRAT